MSLYFSAAVWASLALCVACSFENHLPRYRTEVAVASAAVSGDRHQPTDMPVGISSSEKR
jgi:hypothetical protein